MEGMSVLLPSSRRFSHTLYKLVIFNVDTRQNKNGMCNAPMKIIFPQCRSLYFVELVKISIVDLIVVTNCRCQGFKVHKDKK